MNRIKNLKKGKYFNEGNIYFPLYDKKINILIDSETPEDYISKCLNHFENLSEELIEKFCEYCILFKNDYEEYLEPGEIIIKENKDILKYIKPRCLCIKTPKNEKIAYQIEFSCQWEKEHGLEIIISENEILYVGIFCDMNPFNEKEKFKKISYNYAKYF